MKRKVNNLLRADVILTFAGFDGTGGAGVSTDIKICSFFNIKNVSVISSIVIQSPFEVFGKVNIKPKIIKEQFSIFNELYNIKVINIGLLGDLSILDFIIQHFPDKKIVFDPIFFSGSGKFRFLSDNEIGRLKKYIKYFYLITPNVPEAEILSNVKISDFGDIEKSMEKLCDMGAQNILIKGGHLKGDRLFDTLLSQDKVYTFDSFSTGYNIHGTGSFLNAAISAFIFKEDSLQSSIKKAKLLLHRAVKKTDKNNPILNI